MIKGHTKDIDHTCEVCKMEVKAMIPHECDPSICKNCKGKGETWLGRNKATGRWDGYEKCSKCEGTGKVIFT